ncbi:MAG: amidohydrolase [bacterium]|nr:amidohydrolase [bacterium]
MTASPNILITHARVFTAEPHRPPLNAPTAVGIAGDRIAFVGSAADGAAWATPGTRIIDAGGGTLTPGLIDSHFHLFFGAMEMGMVQLGGARSFDEIAQRLRRYAAEHPEDAAVHGTGLRYEILPKARIDRHDLDAILADRPLLIMAYDHHNVWANTRALEQTGTINGAATGPNSAIVMGDDGCATGELVEPAAYCLVLLHFDAWARTVKGLVGTTVGVPQFNPARERHWLREGVKLAARCGLTSIHNMDGDAEQAAFYAQMAAAGELGLRVNIPYSIFPSTPFDALAEADAMARLHTGSFVRAGRVKIFLDGVIEARTALLLDDYADQPGWKGDALYTPEHFTALVRECDRRGLQVTVHAIGDGAVRRTLDAVELAQTMNGPRDSRHRIEHIELIHPDDLPRLAALGVIASMQPLHSPLDYPVVPEVFPGRVGADRWWRSYAWQNVRGAGAHMAFGSDYPIVSQDPLTGMYAALCRKPWGEGHPNHRQSLADTLRAYTSGGAYAEFQEHVKGQIKVGMLADLTLFPVDLFAMPPERLREAAPVLTLLGGQPTWDAL